MPSATTTKAAMAGTKRKSAPVKNVHAKESKKPKIDSAVKTALKKGKKAPVKNIEELSDDDSDDSDSDGGAPLGYNPKNDNGEKDEDRDSEFEELPAAEDGLHPERAKAVATNSEY